MYRAKNWDEGGEHEKLLMAKLISKLRRKMSAENQPERGFCISKIKTRTWFSLFFNYRYCTSVIIFVRLYHLLLFIWCKLKSYEVFSLEENLIRAYWLRPLLVDCAEKNCMKKQYPTSYFQKENIIWGTKLAINIVISSKIS